ncbi:MAG: hypothetical protein Q9191_002551 [Dirinaria sp. TL-2023a]
MQLPTLPRMLENHLQRIKNVVHGIQGLLAFLGWAMTIAVFTKSGKTDGRTKYYFALCFFTIPLLVYQAATPIFPRLRRFCNPYAFAAIDVLLALFWLAAFAAVAAWTNAGKDDGCSKFKYGSPGKCKLSEVTVGIGVVIWCVSYTVPIHKLKRFTEERLLKNGDRSLTGIHSLSFLLTSAMSIYSLLYYRQNGSMPGATPSNQQPIEDQTKYAFSSNPHEHDEFNTSDPEIGGAHGHQNPHVAADDTEDAEYEVLHPQPEEEEGAAGPHWSQGHSELGAGADTSYHGAGSYGTHHQQQQQQPEDPFRNPSPYREHSPYRDPHPSVLQAGAVGDPFRDDLALSHDAGGYGAGGGRVNIPDVNDFRPR